MKNIYSNNKFKIYILILCIGTLYTGTETQAQRLAPGVPALVSPSNNAYLQPGKTVQFTWNAPTTGSTPFSYEIYIYNGSSWSNYNAGSDLYYNYLVQETGGSSMCGAGMQWYIKVTNAYGTNYSATWNFTPYPKYSGSSADYGLTPSTSCQSAGTHSIATSQAKYYSFSATSGYTYYFGTCNTGMGCGTNTTWDTYLRIYGTDNSCTISAYDDNSGSCGNGTSYISWTCNSTGTYYLQLTGKTKFDHGTYYLQYKYTCPSLTAGSIASNQSICYNTTPAAFTQVTAPSGGNGTYTYQWQQTTVGGCGSGWGNISGATATTYQAGNLTQTTCYRRVVTSGPCGSANTNTVTVTVYANLTAGSVGSNQSICYNTSPAAFTQISAPSGGTGSYTYQWQSTTVSGCGSGWSNVSGATASTYNFTGNLTQTTCYRRNVTSGSCGTVSTSAITVTVYANLTAGSVGSNQSICYNTSPAAFTQTAAPTGGTGSYTYQWQSTTVSGCGSGWGNVSGATASTYQAGNLTQTTCYRRNVTSGSCGTVSSAAITVTVYDLPVADAGSDTTIFVGDSVQLGSSPVGGYTYLWSPTVGLSDSTVANPWAKPLYNQIYYLTVFDESSCSNYDSIIIFTSEFFIDTSITFLCGTDADFFKSLAVYDTLQAKYSTPADQFPPQLIEYCGVFALYYEDLNTSNNAGFADLSVGMVRRNALCAVLDYIQNVFDFTSININNNEFIRIYIDESFDPVFNPAPVGTNFLGQGGPYFNDLQAPQLVNGFVFDYMNTGTDPTTSNNYHGYLQLNFDKTNGYIIPWWNDYTQSITNCKYDLYTVLLHEVGHILGWFSLIGYTDWPNDKRPISKIGNDQYSFYDYSLHKGPNQYPLNLQKIVDGTQNQPYLNQNFANDPNALLDNEIWLGENSAPDNHPVYSGYLYNNWSNLFAHNSVLSHLDEQMWSYSVRSRISPGDNVNYVMGPFAINGEERRVLSIPELKKFDALGYTYIGSINLSNLPPYSEKMAGYSGYNTFLIGTFPEDVAADFSPLVNNIGTSLVINLWDDNTLIDPENDQISIVPGSLTNIRGCGNIGLNDYGIISGNNHNSLALSNNNQTITYTPRTDFWGRAQIGFKIWDGEYEGSYVFYTIDVLKGTNVTCNSNNLIINGDFEAGTEVKRLGTEETMSATVRENPIREGKIVGGIHFADAHPYNYQTNGWSPFGSGDLIKHSYIDCNGSLEMSQLGSSNTSFPVISLSQPDANNGIGQRYRRLSWKYNFFNLCKETVQFQKYSLKFDYYYTGNSNITLPLTIAFTNGACWFPNNPVLTYSFVEDITLVPNTWTQVEIHFIYCSDVPANILNLQDASNVVLQFSNRLFIDNLELTEEFNPPLSVDITSLYSPTICEGQNITLEAVVSNPLCNTLYNWQPGNFTTQSIIVSPTTTTTYTVTVTDDLGNTATDEVVITVNAANWPYQPNTPYGVYREQGTDVAVDNDGYVYAVGNFDEEITFMNTFTSTNNSNDIYVVKFDPCGNVIWDKQIGGDGDDKANSIIVDNNGDIIITGYFSNIVNFGYGNKSSLGEWDLFVVKYDSDGDPVWWDYTYDENFYFDQGHDVAVDANNHVYVVGTVYNIDFDVFLAKLNASSGNEEWQTSYNTSLNPLFDYGHGIAYSSNLDQIIITGQIDNDKTYIGKYNPANGNAIVLPSQYTNLNYITSGRRLITYYDANATENIAFIAGSIDLGQGNNKDILLLPATIDGTNISYQTPVVIGGLGVDFATDLVYDPAGFIFVTGQFTDDVNFNVFPACCTIQGGYDNFVAKYNIAQGVYNWATSSEGTSTETSVGIAMNNVGFGYVTGEFFGTSILGAATLYSHGSGDAFIARLHDLLTYGVYESPTDPTSTPTSSKAMVNEMLLYPSPAYNQLNIAVKLKEASPAIIEMYDIYGNKIKTIANTSIAEAAFTVNVSHLAKGAYIIRLTSNGFTSSQRFLIIK